MEEKYYVSEEEMKRALFPDDFIAWLIGEIDTCDEHLKHFNSLTEVKHWVYRKTSLQEIRNKYQELILDKKRGK